jgi:hypothetical protein
MKVLIVRETVKAGVAAMKRGASIRRSPPASGHVPQQSRGQDEWAMFHLEHFISHPRRDLR